MTATSVVLEQGVHTAVVDRAGGRLTDYRVGERAVIAGQEDPEFFAFRGSLLAPWPNRLTDGRWSWRGTRLELPLNDPTGVPSALHGLVIDAEFTVVERTATTVELEHHLPGCDGYPFPLQLRVSYALTGGGLACSLTSINVGDQDAPVGLGAHPYLAAAELVDDVTLTLPAQTVLLTDGDWREVGRRSVDKAGLDFRRGRVVADLEIDAAFTDLVRGGDGRVDVGMRRGDGAEVTLSSGSTCRWLVVYTGDGLAPADRRRSMAVEPMTCPPNALETGEIDIVPPGGSLTLDWMLSVR